MEQDRTGIAGLVEDVVAWRASAGARVPSYDRLLAELGGVIGAPESERERAARDRVATAWAGRSFSAAYDRPLLVLAALRADAAEVGPSHPLWNAIVREPPDPGVVTRASVVTALADAGPGLGASLRQRWVQTNETSRAVAWLWPAHLCGVDSGRPLVLFDLGASAGLNLVGADLPALWSTDDGEAVPVAKSPRFAVRLGIDARPVDVSRLADVAWLRACVWPGEPHRQQRLELALAAWKQAQSDKAPPVVEAADLADVLPRLSRISAAAPDESLCLAYQTLVFDYLPASVRARYVDGMRAWLREGKPGTRAWIELETSADADPAWPAALEAEFVGVNGQLQSQTLARTNYHPRVLRIEREAVAAFVQACGQK